MQLQQQRFACGFFLSQLLQGSVALLRLRWFLQLELPVLLQVCGSLRHNQPITLPMQMLRIMLYSLLFLLD
jgi:hypothetical protein